jgi:1,4-alpha-glucan branching enzyme/maltooligosyltrehalose trehalohydrolase
MPDDLKRLICAAHARNLMVFLDVVYNHFGPEGNYLHAYAPQFFNARHQTPWGAAINFDDELSSVVRGFYVHNALYWLEEFNFDGLRLDAVHAIADESGPHILSEIAEAVARHLPQRHIHLVLENDDNAVWPLTRAAHGHESAYAAQWNDDFHHALHVLLTGEGHGYYADYAADPGGHLARSLTEGFSYQGEASQHRGGRRRGEPSGHLPPTAFVSFIQNHDQIGNRPFGDRIDALAPADAVRAATFILLLAPSIPLLFMGEEWATEQPFRFFCDFEPNLAAAVREGRRNEFAHFFQAAGAAAIPDATDPASFEACVLRWQDRSREPHAQTLDLYRHLLAIRHQSIIPRLRGTRAIQHSVFGPSRRTLTVAWRMGDGAILSLIANLDRHPIRVELPADRDALLAATDPTVLDASRSATLPPWFVGWWLQQAQSG